MLQQKFKNFPYDSPMSKPYQNNNTVQEKIGLNRSLNKYFKYFKNIISENDNRGSANFRYGPRWNRGPREGPLLHHQTIFGQRFVSYTFFSVFIFYFYK